MQVEIYLFLSKISAGKAAYSYRLECKRLNHITTGGGSLENTDIYRLPLTCAIEALGHMLRPAEITIYTDSQKLVNLHRYLKAWADNNWKKADGKTLKNADLWQQLCEKEQDHEIQYIYEPNMEKFRKEN